MKKRILFFSLALFSIIFIVGCNPETQYNYMNDVSTIKSIEIVKVSELKINQKEPDQEILYTVQDINQFMEDLSQIPCYSMSPPGKINYDSPVIKITYKNGDYELIDHSGQSEFKNGIYYSYDGFFSFDEESFEDFINKYVS